MILTMRDKQGKKKKRMFKEECFFLLPSVSFQLVDKRTTDRHGQRGQGAG
jgi:hypothetical protein